MKKNRNKKPRVAKARKNRKISKSRRSSRRHRALNGGFSDPWIPGWKSVRIAGRKIRGMVYVGVPRSVDNPYVGEIGIINPNLPVGDFGNDFAGEGIYTNPPDYSMMEEDSRATYLNWLADRSNTNYSARYVMLYFTGLEVRFFFDRSSRSEKLLILAEAQRLLEIYGSSNHINRILRHFIGMGRLILKLDLDVEPETGNYHPCHSAVLAAIGRKVDARQPLNGKWMLNWHVVNTKLSSAVRRVFPEFKALFISSFDEDYPNGMKADIPDEYFMPMYRSVSFQFPLELSDYMEFVSDLSLASDLLEVASHTADNVEQELEKFTRYVGKDPERRKDLAAYLRLPERIRNQFPNDKAKELLSWAKKVIRNNPVIPFADVVEKVHGTAAESVTRSQTTKIIDTLAGLFIGIAPDPRFTKFNLKLEDSVIVHKIDHTIERWNSVSENYWSVFRQVAVVCFVIQAASRIATSEVLVFDNLISHKKLEAHELERMLIYRNWMLSVPPALPMLRQNLKARFPFEHEELVPIALSMAVARGHVPPERVEAVKKIYKLLNLNDADVYSDLHSQTSGGKPVVFLSESQSKQFSDVPAAGENISKFELDSKRIDSVVRDTAQVSEVLGEIFSDDGHTPEGNQPVIEDGLLPGLDKQHALLALEMLQRDRWENEELQQLAGRFNLMPAGALETLNEWAFERFEEPLIEEYDGYNLNLDLVERLETL